MNVNVQVDSSTLPHQFVALSNLFRELSGTSATAAQPQHSVVETNLALVGPSNLTEPEVVVVTEDKPAVTRRRRTKAEIEAEAAEKAALDAAAEAEAKAQEDAISGEVAAVATTVVEEPKVDEFEKVAAGGKTFTEAEAQQLATVVARTKGPQVVKDKIAELGATRIGDLTADQLNELGNFLEAQK